MHNSEIDMHHSVPELSESGTQYVDQCMPTKYHPVHSQTPCTAPVRYIYHYSAIYNTGNHVTVHYDGIMDVKDKILDGEAYREVKDWLVEDGGKYWDTEKVTITSLTLLGTKS